MLKKHFTILVLLALMTVGVFAQSIPSGTGRYEALGNSPFILDAASDMYSNPVWNNYYRNYAFGDIGSGYVNDFQLNGQFGGVTVGFKKWNLGLIVNKRMDVFNRFYDDSTYRPAGTPIVPVELLIGYTLNKNLFLTLAPYYSGWSYSQTTTDLNNPDIDNASSSLGAKLGVLYFVKKGWVEGVVTFGMNKFKDVTTVGDPSVTTTTENDGGIDLGVNLRAWIIANKTTKLAFIPVLGFETYSWNGKSTTGSVSSTGIKHSYLNLNAAAGLNLPISDDIQIAGGLSFFMNSTKVDSGSYEAKETITLLPGFNLAGEFQIADWLTGRAGFSKGMYSGKSTYSGTGYTNEYKWKWEPDVVQTVSLGAGFHVGRFSLDATVAEAWVKRGPYILSGQPTDMFGVVSASYNFNK